MKFRKVVLLFLILAFGVIVEGVHFGRTAIGDDFDFPNFRIDGPFGGRGARVFRGPSYDYTANQSVSGEGVSAIEITNAFGDVTVRRSTGPKGEISVVLRKEVFTRRAEEAEPVANRVKLVAKRDGSLLRVSSTRDDAAEHRVKTYFEIQTPEALDIKIVNRNGRVVVEGARSVNLSGEFDEMRIVDVSGECVAKNRHGDLEVISAAMGCRVEVEYGNAHLERLLAASRAEVSHGDLNALNLAALTVNLKFGDLQARKIAGGLTVEGERSSLRIDDCKGDVSLKNQGDIDIQNIGGNLAIENRRGHVKVRKAAGGLIVNNSFDEVAASEIGGLLEINNQHGSIRVQGFSKGARLETDSEDVNVSDFAGPLHVVANRADISIKPMRKVVAPMDVTVDIGDVLLGLPESIDAQVDAAVERGDVVGEVGALRSSEQGKRLLRATIGAGGPVLRLRSRLGDIKLASEDDVDGAEPDSPSAPDIDGRGHGLDPLPAAPVAPMPPADLPKPPKPAKGAVAPPEPPARPSPEGR